MFFGFTNFELFSVGLYLSSSFAFIWFSVYVGCISKSQIIWYRVTFVFLLPSLDFQLFLGFPWYSFRFLWFSVMYFRLTDFELFGIVILWISL